MSEFNDSKSTREAVYSAFQKCKDVRLRERYYCVLLAYDGHNCCEIAAILCRDLSTIRQWIKVFNEGGLEGLRKPSPRTARLAAQKLEMAPSHA